MPTTESTRKKILVAVSGMSPQIITETLYGLMQQADEPWLPDEIHLITTLQGKEQARLQLLEGPAHFRAFLKDYGIASVPRFDASTMHVITDDRQQPLQDLKTPADNEHAANFITDKIRHLSADPACELHVSLAGGRKTMGFYVGYALSMFGRPQDRLSHVLVSGEYESLRDFFYPTPDTRVIYRQAGEKQLPLDAAKAQVWLANIPFIRLRSFLSDNELLQQLSFSEVVERLALATQPGVLHITEDERTLRFGNIKCKLAPNLFCLYLLFARRALNGKPGLRAPADGAPSPELAELLLQELEILKSEKSGSLGKTRKALETGMELGFFTSTLSKLNAHLKRHFGPELADKIGIGKTTGARGTEYQLTMAPKHIRWD